MARKGFGGFDLVNAVNRIQGKVAVALNVRAYVSGGWTLRSLLTDAILTVSGAIQTISRLNDSTPSGPVGGFTYVIKDVLGNIYNGVSGTLTAIATGLSENPVSIVPFRPNTAVDPWDYIGDVAPTPTGSITYANILTKYALDDTTTVTYACSGMVKVRSDGRIYKMGIMEPQTAPDVSTAGTTTEGSGTLPATAIPWTNVAGANPTYNYGHTSGGDGTAPVVIALPAGSQQLTVDVSGSATVNGSTHGPNDVGPSTSTYPGFFTTSTQLVPHKTIVVGAFTDGSGNVLTGTSPPIPFLLDVGDALTMNVPAGAVQFQLGIDSSANTFSANSGSYSYNWTLITSAVATKVSTLGDVTAYYWGDSPHSGPVADYIWKNPNDVGSGIPRSIGTAAGSAINNSWEFDSSPEDGTVPVQWNTLDTSGSVSGSIPLFTPALESQGFQDFNACITGSIFFPAGGLYTFTLQYKDQIMLGFGGGITLSGTVGITGGGHAPGTQTGPFFGFKGQTETVVNGLPLLYVGRVDSTTAPATFQVATFTVSVPGTGAYQLEIDWDYWEHTGRSLILKLAGGISIPPLPAGVRTNVRYKCTYYSSPTGAESNPGPSSAQEVTPVLDNTVTCAYSTDPQVDKVNYWRQDSGLPNFTFVGRGPNTNPPTPIVDSATDLEVASNPILQFDNFEPFPSIDLPQSGTCNVVGGIVTRLTGGPFNIRWLPGTLLLVGASTTFGTATPPQIAYAAVRRPSGVSTWDFTGLDNPIPDGTNLLWNIAEPILAAQPLAYLFGPTDNINFMFGVGDPLRPGTLYWSKGSNLDSAPDTNQMDVTDPSEPLVNGCMSGGRGVLASIKRFWVIMPNFFNAEATATGTSGSTWTLQATSITRGLFIPRCLAVSGGGTIFFRVDDGIHVSPGGLGSESITDGDLYPLFSHEGSTPVAVTRNGITIQPPDDDFPLRQQFSYQNGYLYYDYWGMDDAYHTLVFDEAAGGWIYDLYATQTLIHAPNESESVQGILVGCTDGTLRSMAPGGTETPTGTLLTPAIGGQGFMYIQEVTIEYSSNDVMTFSTLAADAGNGSYGAPDVILPSTGGDIAKTKFLVGVNKWKLAWFQFSSSDPTFKVFTEGFAVRCKNWGSKEPYKQVDPFMLINPYFPQQGGFGGEN